MARKMKGEKAILPIQLFFSLPLGIMSLNLDPAILYVVEDPGVFVQFSS